VTDLIAQTPLGGADPQRMVAGDLTLTEVCRLSLASLAGAKDSAKDCALPALAGLTLPKPGGWAEAEGVGAVWLAPHTWLLSDAAVNTDLALRLGAECSDCAITDQSDVWAVFDLTGPGAAVEACLERLVNLAPAALSPGHGQRTLVGHLSVIVIRCEAGHVRLLGMRSAAGSLCHHLVKTMEVVDALREPRAPDG